jgi:Glycosyl hydrolase family 79, N-terminal domain
MSALRRIRSRVSLALATGLAVIGTPLLVLLTSQPSHAAGAVVDLSRSPVVARVSPRYVSFAVDLDQVVGGLFWNQAPGATGKVQVTPYDFARPRLMALTRALAPAYLRISGTAADGTYYDLSRAPTHTPPPRYSRILTRAEWDAVNRFALALNLQIFLGVDAGPGPRDAAGNWTSTDAAWLLGYTASRHYPLAAVEFGNEPNLFSITGGMPASYGAADYVRDLGAFRGVLKAIEPHVLLTGPAAFYNNAGTEFFNTSFGPLASEILPAAGNLYDAITWHAYPAASSRCRSSGASPVPADPLAPAYLDGIVNSYADTRTLDRAYAGDRPVWYGEGASAFCGGQQGYSDRWEATFWYLNALGALSQRGVQVFVRQTLSGSDYGLINEATLQPNTDYWAALLWHRLMGVRILQPRVLKAPARLRVFAACSRSGRGVTLLALNLDARHAVQLKLEGSGRREVYLATSPQLLSPLVELNGRTLRATRNGEAPPLRPRVTRSSWVSLPAASYAFVALPEAAKTACG